jgi:hypothetical protein
MKPFFGLQPRGVLCAYEPVAQALKRPFGRAQDSSGPPQSHAP